MKYIQITKGKTAIVDDEDYDRISRHPWQADEQRGEFRAVRTSGVGLNKKHIKMHREVLGISDKKILIDHINRNPLDNRKENLRVCLNAENLWNVGKRKNNTSGYKGVSFCKQTGKYKARFKLSGEEVWVGRFDTAEEAAIAYDKEIIKRRKEFASPNFG